MIRKLLVANRGEIAVRVFRTAREMGIGTVAVYSEADAASIHVQMADESVCIGGAEPSQSYLNVSAVLDAAKATGADAIHPGYGFLSERAEFADACSSGGVTFIGPSGTAMRALGSKIAAKKLAVAAGVPVTPGYFEADATPDQLREAADRIGYPVMLKASAGGGGRGMRVVRDPDRFDEELRIASDEALKGFGDGAMMVEKLIDSPRHIEVQVLADKFGNVACLFERECSLQRRHQKLVEEAPSPVLSEDGWNAMRAACERLIRTAGYVGAGTVEFVANADASEFYFLEVNARLQVEHPVTEAITGLDLVRWQIRIAQGESLDQNSARMTGDRTSIVGHAIEARVVAEDPGAGFMPSVGKLLAWCEPKGPGVRIDTGYGNGCEVPRFYDSLIAKVIAHAETRAEAIDRLRRALSDFHVLGVKTNIAYLLDVLDHADFRSGAIDTGFLGRSFDGWSPPPAPRELGAILEFATLGSPLESGQAAVPGSWDLADGFRL